MHKILGFDIMLAVYQQILTSNCLKIRVQTCMGLCICSTSKLSLSLFQQKSVWGISFPTTSQIKLFNLEVSRLKFVSSIWWWYAIVYQHHQYITILNILCSYVCYTFRTLNQTYVIPSHTRGDRHRYNSSIFITPS